PPLRDFMRRAMHFAIAGLLAAIQLRMIFLLLESISTAKVLGWYAAASRFVEAAKMPPFALFGAIFPALSALQPHDLKRTFRRTNTVLALYALAAGVVFMLLGGWVIGLMFGDEFKNAAPILTLLGWSLLPGLLRQNLITHHYAENR